MYKPDMKIIYSILLGTSNIYVKTITFIHLYLLKSIIGNKILKKYWSEIYLEMKFLPTVGSTQSDKIFNSLHHSKPYLA